MLAWFRCRRRRRGSPAACLGDCGGGPFLGGAAKGPQEHFILDPDFDVAAAELICIYECDWAPQLRDAQVGRAASAEAVAAHHFIAPSVSGDIIGNDPDEEEGRSWPATVGANIFVTLDPIVTMPTEAVVVAKPRTPSEGARRCAPGGASRSRGAHAGIAIPRSSLRLGLRRPRSAPGFSSRVCSGIARPGFWAPPSERPPDSFAQCPNTNFRYFVVAFYFPKEAMVPDWPGGWG